MRTIKFRAWNNKYKQMTRDGFSFDGFDDDCFCDWSALPGGELWYLRDMEVMQFTGLYDKNGKEIYEGDIVRRNKYTVESGRTEMSEPFEIIWDSEKAGFEYKTNGYQSGLFFAVHEVIGNIYENPELLK